MSALQCCGAGAATSRVEPEPIFILLRLQLASKTENPCVVRKPDLKWRLRNAAVLHSENFVVYMKNKIHHVHSDSVIKILLLNPFGFYEIVLRRRKELYHLI